MWGGQYWLQPPIQAASRKHFHAADAERMRALAAIIKQSGSARLQVFDCIDNPPQVGNPPARLHMQATIARTDAAHHPLATQEHPGYYGGNSDSALAMTTRS